jgi:dolichol-phosphate mannosyltransferase
VTGDVVGDDGIAVSVVVMAYNEADTVESTTREIAATLATLAGRHEIIVVDDGSADGTGTIADRLAGSIDRLRVVHHPVNAGLGGVYRTGFAEAQGQFLTFFPADGQFPATIIPDFVAAIANADFVLGYIPDRRGSLLGRALSTSERTLYRVLFGRFPRFQGIFMCRTTALRALPLRSVGRGWAVVMELLLRADRASFRMVNRPTPLRPRMAGRTKVHNVRTIIANTQQMIALRRRL